MTRIGTRKLHYLIKPSLDKIGIRCGRDRLNAILKYEDGALCVIDCAFDSSFGMFARVVGNQGTITVPDAFGVSSLA